MQITIHKLPGCEYLDYRVIKPLQDTPEGSLKDLSEENYTKLKKSLLKHGFTFPGFVWRNGDNYFAIDMHQRLRVMTQEDANDNGSYEIPVVFIPAKDEKEAKEKLLLATSQYGTITQEGLDTFIAIAELPQVEMYEAVHFDALPLLGQVSEDDTNTDTKEDDAPDVAEGEAISQPGEVYQLGRHRVMCGSSTDPEQMKTLMGGASADMVFTDPPYGVDYVSRVDKTRRKPWGGIINDDLEGEKLRSFLFDSVGELNVPRYVCCNWQSVVDFFLALGKPNAFIVWDKGSIGLGAGYRNQHEIILFYGTLDHNSESNVWQIKRDASSDYKHPTQKPIAIPARGIKNSSKPGDIVLDLFLGSGSTLIACEQLDRTCYGMELDPKYVDVIRKRWHKLVDPESQDDEWVDITPAIVEYSGESVEER